MVCWILMNIEFTNNSYASDFSDYLVMGDYRDIMVSYDLRIETCKTRILGFRKTKFTRKGFIFSGKDDYFLSIGRMIIL